MDILTLLDKKKELETKVMAMVNEFEQLVPDINLRALRIDIDPDFGNGHVRRARIVVSNILTTPPERSVIE